MKRKSFTRLLFVFIVAMSTAMPAFAVIDVQPVGTVVEYERSQAGTCLNTYDGGAVIEVINQWGPLEITFTSTSTCYIKNIICMSEYEFGDYWVVGTLSPDGKTITVPLGQEIRSSRGNPVVLGWGTVILNQFDNSVHSFTQDASVSSVTYAIDGNTIHIEGTSSGPVVVDDSDDYIYATGPCTIWRDEVQPSSDYPFGQFAGFIEWNTEAEVVVPYVIWEEPIGTRVTYQRTGESVLYTTTTAGGNITTDAIDTEGVIVYSTDGKTVFLKDPVINRAYGTWVRGSITEDGNSIIVPMGQCIYYSDTKDEIEAVYLNWGKCYFTNNINFEVLDKDLATYSIVGNTISLTESQGDITSSYPFNLSAQGLCTIGARGAAVETHTVYSLDEQLDKTPMPTATYQQAEGQGATTVTITAVEGTVYYRIILDGVPTDWTQYNDEFIVSDEGDYRIEYYAIATGKTRSDIGAIEFSIKAFTGVNEVNSGKSVASVRYFNVVGQEMTQPTGLTIQVTTYTDGTTSTVKVMK